MLRDVTLTVDLPEDMVADINQEIAKGRFATVGDYLNWLYRDRILRERRKEVEAKLLEALESEAIPVTNEFWEEVKREGLAKLAALRRKKEAS